MLYSERSAVLRGGSLAEAIMRIPFWPQKVLPPAPTDSDIFGGQWTSFLGLPVLSMASLVIASYGVHVCQVLESRDHASIRQRDHSVSAQVDERYDNLVSGIHILFEVAGLAMIGRTHHHRLLPSALLRPALLTMHHAPRVVLARGRPSIHVVGVSISLREIIGS